MKHYTLVAQRAGHRCEYCHAPEVIFNFPFTSDPSGNIIGTTAIGRSTVACLRMNNQSQVAAREQWIQLGLFP